MTFKYKEVNKKIITSFLTFSLLVSSPIGLSAKETEKKEKVKSNTITLDSGFDIHLPEPSKVKVEKLNIEKENVFSRYYAHNGVYMVRNDKITFRSFDYLPIRFIKPLDNTSKLISTCFLQIKKEPLHDYMLIFTLFKDGSFRYYVFKHGSNDYLINTFDLPKFNFPEDTTIKVHDVDLEKNTYSINIKSDKLGIDETIKSKFVLE